MLLLKKKNLRDKKCYGESVDFVQCRKNFRDKRALTNIFIFTYLQGY